VLTGAARSTCRMAGSATFLRYIGMDVSSSPRHRPASLTKPFSAGSVRLSVVRQDPSAIGRVAAEIIFTQAARAVRVLSGQRLRFGVSL
jgi:hypothetical protein